MQSPKFKSTGKLRVDALSRLLPGFESSCRLPIPSRRELRISNFEPSTSNFSPPNFKSSGKLLVDNLSDCSQLRIPSCNFTANFESRAASFEFSPRELQIKRALIEIRLYKEYRIYVSITIKSLLKLQRFD